MKCLVSHVRTLYSNDVGSKFQQSIANAHKVSKSKCAAAYCWLPHSCSPHSALHSPSTIAYL